MFFYMLAHSVNIVLLVAAAIIPAAVILGYVYRKDTVEREPTSLIVNLLLAGVLAGMAAGSLESVGQMILQLFLPRNSLVYLVLMAFLVVAASEEGMKLLFLRSRTWNNPHFNYTFDAIVYAVAVSIGFAAFENIFYVLEGGFQTAVARALLSVPGHAAWGVIMGYYYGQAKVLAATGEKTASERMLKRAFIVPMLLHGFYDTCAFLGGAQPMAILYLFSFAVDRNVIARLASESHADKLVGPVGGAFVEEPPVESHVHASSSFCPRCGVANPTTHVYCFSCGQRLR